MLSAIAVGALAQTGAAAVAAPAPTTTAVGDVVFLAANLNGKNEISRTGQAAAGDPDGRARTVVRIQGDQVTFTTSWSGIGAPTAAHVHAGKAGTNGAVASGFFGSALPTSLRSVTGSVTATEATMKANPGDFYVNLHTAEFPDGAVRGQLHLLDTPADLLAELRGPLVALADGGQETPALGDLDGRATGFVRAKGDRVTFGVTWAGIAPPTLAHIHSGRIGGAGGVAVGLFAGPGATPAPLPDSLFAAAGEVDGLDPAVVKQVNRKPADFYLNLHNAEFGAGAVRGQLFGAGNGTAQARTFTAPVLRGVQIYACTKQADNTFKFTQHDVRATLKGNIEHSFVTPGAGPPRWVAPDGSAVSAKVITRTPNGTGNIDELELDATQIGDASGRMANVVEILRLNTVGGVAPAGTCDPARQPTVEVPYRADYLFIAS